MFCSNCGAEVPEESKFCTKCGTKMFDEPTSMHNQTASSEEVTNPAVNQNVEPAQNTIVNQNVEPVQNTTIPEQKFQEKMANNETVKKGINIIMFYIAVLLKPIKSFKEKESEISKVKNAIIFTCISSAVYAIANVITTIFNTVIVKSFWGGETKWVWDNLKNINFFKLTFQSFFIPLCAMAIIALVYYAFAFIFKKKINYIKVLSVISVAIMPAIICKMILGPLVSLIWDIGGSLISTIGSVYSVIVILFAINNEVEFENKDMLIYYNASAVASIAAIATILFSTILSPVNAIKSTLDSYLDKLF